MTGSRPAARRRRERRRSLPPRATTTAAGSKARSAPSEPGERGNQTRTFLADKQMRQKILLGRANRTDILMPLLLVRDPSTKDTGTSFCSSTRSRPNRSRRTTSPPCPRCESDEGPGALADFLLIGSATVTSSSNRRSQARRLAESCSEVTSESAKRITAMRRSRSAVSRPSGDSASFEPRPALNGLMGRTRRYAWFSPLSALAVR